MVRSSRKRVFNRVTANDKNFHAQHTKYKKKSNTLRIEIYRKTKKKEKIRSKPSPVKKKKKKTRSKKETYSQAQQRTARTY